MNSLPLSQQAGILSEDRRFRAFVASSLDMLGEVSALAATHYLRDWCKVDSRRDLDTNPAAAEAFGVLRTEFDVWTGRIARPDPGRS